MPEKLDKKILIVEDEKNTCHALKLILSKAGYNVDAVENGRQALDNILKAKEIKAEVDVVVTDVQMPEMTGLELLDMLEQVECTPEVIGISGYGDRETVLALMRKGCREFIDKPFKPQKLLDIVKKVFDRIQCSRARLSKTTDNLKKEKEDLGRKLDDFHRQVDRLKREINTAKLSHQNITDIDDLNVSIPIKLKQKPLFELGGDVAAIKKTSVGYDFFVADVAGHDLGASYHTAIISSFFNEFCADSLSGVEFLKLLNNILYNQGHNDRMVSAMLLSLNLHTHTARLYSAAHPYLVSYKVNAVNQLSIFRPVTATDAGALLGIFENAGFKQTEFQLSTGQRLFLYTDGVPRVSRIDKILGKKVFLGNKKLREIIKKNYHSSLDEVIERSWSDIMQFCGNRYYDDMLLLGIEIPKRWPNN